MNRISVFCVIFAQTPSSFLLSTGPGGEDSDTQLPVFTPHEKVVESRVGEDTNSGRSGPVLYFRYSDLKY